MRSPLVSEQSLSNASKRRPVQWSGWLIGIVIGVFAVLWTFPAVRYTLLSQFEFAYSVNDIPWIRALTEHQSVREIARLNAVAASDPENYALQLGRATALTEFSRPAARRGVLLPDDTLFRLGQIARNFPIVPGAYAHLGRYMMVDRIRIQRIELSKPASGSPLPVKKVTIDWRLSGGLSPPLTHSVPASRRDVRWMMWALGSGERRDPQNAFWPTMLATTYFAAERDREGLAALGRAARKSNWDAYVYQEVLGQWQLFSTAYGDNGAAQRIGPLSLVAFPHLREIRRMAEMARYLAEQDALRGDFANAILIRRNLAWLGILMCNTAQWAYEALYGTDIFFLASTDSHVNFTSNAVRDMKQWEAAAAPYLALLSKNNKGSETAWLRQEAEYCCLLRQKVDVARYDATYPGIPPGIPLLSLFASWMAGTCILQEMLGLGVIALLAWSIVYFETNYTRNPRPLRALLWITACTITLVCALFLMVGLPTPTQAGLTLLGVALLITQGIQWLAGLGKAKRLNGQRAPTPINLLAEVERRWSHGTSLRFLLVLFVPGLIALYFLRYTLSGLHPVAILLAGLIGAVIPPKLSDAFLVALLGIAVPLGLITLSAVWGAYRHVAPLAAVAVAFRRLTVPALLCLTCVYLGLMQSTLRLDRQASLAIDEAAQNDLRWVLTHSSDAGRAP